MMEELDYTQEQVAERMGKERSTVTNYIRLTKTSTRHSACLLEMEALVWDMQGLLVNVDTVDRQLFIFKEIKEKGLSVRQTEELVRQLYKNEDKTVKPPAKSTLPPAYKRIEDNLASHFGTKVKLAHNKKGFGSISIDYYSLQELNKILEQMNVSAS